MPRLKKVSPSMFRFSAQARSRTFSGQFLFHGLWLSINSRAPPLVFRFFFPRDEEGRCSERAENSNFLSTALPRSPVSLLPQSGLEIRLAGPLRGSHPCGFPRARASRRCAWLPLARGTPRFQASRQWSSRPLAAASGNFAILRSTRARGKVPYFEGWGKVGKAKGVGDVEGTASVCLSVYDGACALREPLMNSRRRCRDGLRDRLVHRLSCHSKSTAH